MYLWIAGALLVLAGLGYSYIASHPSGIIDGKHEGDVRTTVAQFGNQIDTVSLESPDAREDIRNAYASYVTPELLALWQEDPSKAPGNLLAASDTDAWADYIEVDSVVLSEDGTYAVEGRIMLMAAGGDSGSIPVSLTVSDVGGSYLITRYEENPVAPLTEELEETSVRLTAALGIDVEAFGVSVTPFEIIEDSRCPPDVQCIQAGTLRVAAATDIGDGPSLGDIFTLNDGSVIVLANPQSTMNPVRVRISLVEAVPMPFRASPINGDYYLTFLFERI